MGRDNYGLLQTAQALPQKSFPLEKPLNKNKWHCFYCIQLPTSPLPVTIFLLFLCVVWLFFFPVVSLLQLFDCWRQKGEINRRKVLTGPLHNCSQLSAENRCENFLEMWTVEQRQLCIFTPSRLAILFLSSLQVWNEKCIPCQLLLPWLPCFRAK